MDFPVQSRLLDYLEKFNLVSADKLRKVIQESIKPDPFNEIEFVSYVLKKLQIPWVILISNLSKELNLEVIVSVHEFLPAPLETFDVQFFKENNIYPFKIDQSVLTILTSNPFSSSVFDYISYYFKKSIELNLATPEIIDKFLRFNSEKIVIFSPTQQNLKKQANNECFAKESNSKESDSYSEYETFIKSENTKIQENNRENILRINTSQKLINSKEKIRNTYKNFLPRNDKLLTIADKSLSSKHLIDDYKIEEHPVLECIQRFLKKGLFFQASDIHVESIKNNKLRIRYRIDGSLSEETEDLLNIFNVQIKGCHVIAKLKLMAHLDITEKRLPQDGRFQMFFGNDLIDVRMSVIPSLNGETITLRILEKSKTRLHINDLGFSNDEIDKLRWIIAQRRGLVLISGPTGSGKTTTIYSILSYLLSLNKKIITVENPVEYQVDGINQVQINSEKNIDFGSALRSSLRQNPDVLMIGEIRDQETALIATQATLAGHFVITSVHASDAISAIARITNLGVKNYLLSETLSASIAQRLLRKLCNYCKQTYLPTKEELDVFNNVSYSKIQSTYKTTGCAHCHNTGYFNRTGIFEILMCSPEVKNAIRSCQNISELKKSILSHENFNSLLANGIKTMENGIIGIQDVIKFLVSI